MKAMDSISKFKRKHIFFLFVLILFLGNNLSIEAKPTSSKSLESLVTNLPSANFFFIGRQGNLEELRGKLKTHSGSVAIVGMAGIGKTQLAKKYAFTYADSYDVVWWIDANQDLISQIRELGLKLSSTKNCPMPNVNERSQELWIGSIKSCCAEYFPRVLILIDDVNNEGLIKPVFQILTNAHILLTSRDPSIGERKMNLKRFSRNESIEYLRTFLSNHSQSPLDQLAETLNDYPLALKQAATYINLYPSLSSLEYIRLYKEKRKILWKEEEKFMAQKSDEQISLDYHHTISSTYTLLLDQVKTFPHAIELLKFSSFLGSQDIPKELLKKWMIDYRQVNDFDFHSALSSLIKLSIFEAVESSNEKESYFNIHALLQEFIRESLDEKEREQYLAELTSLIATYLPESSQQIWKVLSQDRHFESCLDSLLRFADRYNFRSDELLKLKIKHLHFLLFFKSDIQTVSEKINELKQEVRNSTKIPPHEKARFLILFANFTTIGSNCEEATSLSEEAENLLTNNQAQEAREDLFFLLVNNLMDYYNLKGDLKKAEKAAKKAEHLLPYINDVNYIALYYFIRSSQLINKGEYSEALRHIDLSIEKLPATDFPPYVHFFKKVMKAEILAKLGELEKASKLAEINYKGLKKIYPHAANYKILKSEIILAFIYLKQGRLEEASNYIKSVIDGLNTFYKKPYESPLQVGPHLLLGELYEKQNEFLKALTEYNKAEDIYRHIYSTVEVDDMSYLYKNMAILGEKIRDDFITKQYFHLLLTHFGRNHPKTQEVADYLEEKGRQVPWSKL